MATAERPLLAMLKNGQLAQRVQAAGHWHKPKVCIMSTASAASPRMVSKDSSRCDEAFLLTSVPAIWCVQLLQWAVDEQPTNGVEKECYTCC